MHSLHKHTHKFQGGPIKWLHLLCSAVCLVSSVLPMQFPLPEALFPPDLIIFTMFDLWSFWVFDFYKDNNSFFLHMGVKWLIHSNPKSKENKFPRLRQSSRSPCLLRKRWPVILLRPSAGWMRPTHMMEGNLLYWFKCQSYLKISSQQQCD